MLYSGAPQVVFAINPMYAITYLTHNGLAGFLILSSVILCATGGEALYADMGHLGREPIVKAWYLVFIALAINYFGQGAFLIAHPGAQNVLFDMIFAEAKLLYIPFLILSIAATVIASQAMISGIFSIVYQSITTRVLPLLRIEYTSPHLRSQIYIDSVNWMLLFAVLMVILVFRSSINLAHAYGLAVTGTMTITGILIIWILVLRGEVLKSLIAGFVLLVTGSFLISNLHKIPQGGYWSLVIAAVPLTIILIYVNGQRRLANSLKPVPLDEFIPKFNALYKSVNRIQVRALLRPGLPGDPAVTSPARCLRTTSYTRRISSYRSSGLSSRSG